MTQELPAPPLPGFRIRHPTMVGICLPFGSRRVLTAACRMVKSS